MIRPSPDRRDPRYRVGPQLVQVTIQRRDGGDAQSSMAELCDVSRGGAKLRAAEALPFQEALQLDLASEALNLQLSVNAEVCWSRPDGGEWTIGCSFTPELPAESLEVLFNCGLLERRGFPRIPCRDLVGAQWELESVAAEAWLCDISEGGFCLLSPHAQQAGKRVMISLDYGDRAASVPVKTQWQMRVDEGYMLGCEFLSKSGYIDIRSWQAARSKRDSSASPLAGGLLRRLLPWRRTAKQG